MKKAYFSSVFIVASLMVANASAFAVGAKEVQDESNSLLMVTALANMEATILNEHSSKASISVSDLQCLTSADESVSCTFTDRPTGKQIRLAEGSDGDLAFDVRAAVNRATGADDTLLKSVQCTWNDANSGSGKYRCVTEK